MKKTLGIFGLVVLLFSYFSYEVKNDVLNAASLAYAEGDQIEQFTLQNLNNRPVSLDSVITNNRYVWVNFWATWCGPCRREMPMMTEIFNEYGDQGFAIVAVSVGEDSATVQGYLEENPVPFTIVLDSDRTVTRQFNVKTLPTSFLVDSTGTILRTGTGVQENWDFIISNKFEDTDGPLGNIN